ncbi:hypothetical protein VNI00_016331 [Paramarasmius palmivorus]|uniref:Fungal-type protein kinase domain-containing protein n=1 Tax=Paramarasmius palmivorus TaxID=297713 RepID=A0AAW0BCZ1_9AGAR
MLSFPDTSSKSSRNRPRDEVFIAKVWQKLKEGQGIRKEMVHGPVTATQGNEEAGEAPNEQEMPKDTPESKAKTFLLPSITARTDEVTTILRSDNGSVTSVDHLNNPVSGLSITPSIIRSFPVEPKSLFSRVSRVFREKPPHIYDEVDVRAPADVKKDFKLTQPQHIKTSDMMSPFFEGVQAYSRKSHLHDIKTGSPSFVAVEVQAGEFLFEPEDEFAEEEGDPMLSKISQAPFRNQHLHDLECLFWILTYFTFANHPSDEEMDKELIHGRLYDFHTLFPYPLRRPQDVLVRLLFLKGGRTIRTMVTRLFPKKFQALSKKLYFIAGDLKREYERIERNTQELLAEEPLALYDRALACLNALLHSSGSDAAWLGDVVSLFDTRSSHLGGEPTKVTPVATGSLSVFFL